LRRQQDVDAVGDEVADRVPQLPPASRIETRGGLVEEQQSGPADEAGAEVESPAHAARVRADEAVAGVGEADAFEGLLRGRVGFDDGGHGGSSWGFCDGLLTSHRRCFGGQCYDPPRPRIVTMAAEEWLADRFEEYRAHLRAVAYRMLGSLSEADDAVQEAWLRLARSDTSDVANLTGWLTTVVGRVCLDMLRARRSRHEEPLEAHVPDPILSTADGISPEHEALLADSVGLALLV